MHLRLWGPTTVPRVGPDSNGLVVRRALPADAERRREIYAAYVRDTVVSLEEEPPPLAQMQARVTRVEVRSLA